MFEREMMIQGLRKQRTLLADLIVELEQRPSMDLHTFLLTNDRTKLVAGNLHKLRKIKDNYLTFKQSDLS